jgi:WD40 repeat protein
VLLRPTWGGWTELAGALFAARNDMLRNGSAEQREDAGGMKALEVLARPASDAHRAAVFALAQAASVGIPSGRRVIDALAAPAAVRNRAEHGAVDEAWWAAIAPHAARAVSVLPAHDVEARAPWFRGSSTYAGITPDRRAVYRSPDGSVELSEGIAPILDAIAALEGTRAARERAIARLEGSSFALLFGDYLLDRCVGEGGFATVYDARHVFTGRRVAVKVLHDHLAQRAHRSIVDEAELLGRFEHPNIVRVVDHGEAAWVDPVGAIPAWAEAITRGRRVKTYLAMEWIDGDTIATALAGAPIATVLRSFREAAEALATVHEAGLVHRDVKPTNLMIDAGGVTRLMDFGVSRDVSTESRGASETSLGTPQYMAPERLRGEAATPSSDLYALCLAYDVVLTGRRLDDLAARARDAPLDRPIALRPDLPWALDALIAGGLEPNPADRPATARALATDLQRIEANEPIRYREPGSVRRLVLAYRRHRAVARIVAASVALLALGLVGSSLSIEVERRIAVAKTGEAIVAREEAEAAAAQARAELDAYYMERALAEAKSEHSDRALAYAIASAELGTTNEIRDRLLERLAGEAETVTLTGHGARIEQLEWIDGGRLLSGSDDGTVRIWSGRAATTYAGNRGATAGARIATVAYDGTVRLFDGAAPGRELHRRVEPFMPVIGPTAGIVSIAVVGDQIVAAARSGAVLMFAGRELEERRLEADASEVRRAGDGYVVRASEDVLRIGRDGRILARWRSSDGPAWLMEPSPDGSQVAIATRSVVVWSEAGTKTLDAWRGPSTFDPYVHVMRWTRSGILVGTDRCEAVIVSPSNGERVATLDHRSLDRDSIESCSVSGAAVAPDRASVATASEGRIHVWSLPDGERTSTFEAPDAEVTALAFDGERVAAAFTDLAIRIFPTRGPQRLVRLAGHDFIDRVHVSPRGDRIVTIDRPRSPPAAAPIRLRVFDAAGTKLREDDLDEPASVTFLGDDRFLVVSPKAATVRDIDGRPIHDWTAEGVVGAAARASLVVATLPGERVSLRSVGGEIVRTVVIEPAAAEDDAEIARMKSPGGLGVELMIGHEAVPGVARIDADGAYRARTPDGQTVLLEKSAAEVLAWTRPQVAELSPSGGLLFVEDGRGHQHVLEVDSGRPIATHPRDDTATGFGRRPMSYAADESRFAWLLFEAIEVWDRSRRLCRIDTSSASGIVDLAFSPDGRRVVWSHLGATSLWDPDACREVATLDAGVGVVRPITFDPLGRTVAVAGDRKVQIFSAATGERVGSLGHHRDAVMALSFGADGRTLRTGSLDGHLRFFRTEDMSLELDLDLGDGVQGIVDAANVLAIHSLETVHLQPPPQRARIDLVRLAAGTPWRVEGGALVLQEPP